MTDASRAVVWSADYKPFGESTVTISTISNNLRFPGQYYDQETGLYYNYFRDYNPVTGRYIETDPIGIRQGSNHLYAYVQNNPLSRADYNGLASMWVSGGGNAGFAFMMIGINCSLQSAMNINSGEVCSIQTCCYRFGPGLFIGASLTAGGSLSGSNSCDCGKNLKGTTLGVGADFGAPESMGGSLSFSGCSVGISGGAGRMGVGVGFSVGIEVCTTRSLAVLIPLRNVSVSKIIS